MLIAALFDDKVENKPRRVIRFGIRKRGLHSTHGTVGAALQPAASCTRSSRRAQSTRTSLGRTFDKDTLEMSARLEEHEGRQDVGENNSPTL